MLYLGMAGLVRTARLVVCCATVAIVASPAHLEDFLNNMFPEVGDRQDACRDLAELVTLHSGESYGQDYQCTRELFVTNCVPSLHHLE